MKPIDRIFGTIVMGFIIPIATLCIFWWGSFLLKLNPASGAIIGLAIGIAVDMTFLRKLVDRMYTLGKTTLTAVFLLYSVGIFGFFMGVPVFNIITGIMAAFYIGCRARLEGKDEVFFRKSLNQTNRFSTLALTMICILSAYIALTDPYTAANLEGMLSLDFKITKEMLWGLIFAGGVGLLVVQYAVSTLAGKLAYGTHKC